MRQYQFNMFESQRQIYEFQLCLLSVKMKVKFPCRMKIEHLGSLVTGESPPSEDNRFIFNQQLILKDETQRDCFELTVNLLTDKGAKYIAAVIKLYKSELIRSEGERLVLSLSKCIDSEGFCEVKVDQVTAIKTGKNIAPYDRKSTLQRNLPYRKETPDIQLSPYRANPTKILQSKSEYQFPLNNNGAKHDWETKSKSRLLPPQTAYQKSKIAQRINYAVQDPVSYGGHQLGQSVFGGRQKALEAEVYKQGYQKLKQKYKKEAQNSKMELNKRLALQNTQNNLKLEIMRLKLKSDQQEKSLAEKHSKLKEMLTQISLLQQKQVDNGYLREEISKKDANIKMLEDKVRGLARSMEDMREMSNDRSNEQVSRIRDLQMELQSLKVKLQNKEKQFQKDSKAKQQLLHAKEIELISKRDHLDRQKKTVADLQKALQNKGFQLEKLIQNQRYNNKHKIDELKTKSERLQRDIIKLHEEKKDQFKEIEQLKSNTIKIEYDKKILTQQLDSIRVEYNQCRNFREKYNESQRDNKSLIEQKNYLEKQLEKAIQSKEYNLSQINKQFQDQVEYYKRINRQLDQKNKSISNRLIEVEGQLQLSRSQQDKIRRNLQSTVKEAAQAKEKEKVSRKALKAKEQESLSIESQQATMKQKLKSVEQICKLQVDKVREQSEKMRIQLENQIDRVDDLTQTNNKLTIEVNRLKIKLQYSQQKNEKDTVNIRDKQSHIQTLIKDYQQQVSTLDKTINNLRLVQKEHSTKIQRFQIQAIKAEEKNQKQKKQIKILEERCNNFDNTIKTKITQNQTLVTQRDSLAKKLLQLQTEYNNLKSQQLNLTNQRNKLQKMNELLEQQIKKAKIDINNLTLAVSEKEKSEQQLRNLIKQQKEEYAKLDSKFNTYKKQTERYKDTLNDTVQKTICNLPLPGKQEARKSFEDILSKKSASESTFNDIINIIISQSKETRQAFIKQTQQIKQFQRQSERLHEEASVSSNKYQNGEATLKRQLQQLELQIQQVLAQKQAESGNYANIIAQLDERVKQLQLIEQELNTQIQQLNFTINSLKMDNEAMNDQNSKKITNLKKLNIELEEKVEYQLMTITDLDERCSLMQADIDNLQSTIENEIQASHKKDKVIEQLRQIIQNQQRALEQIKKKRKELNERVSQLELHLNTEKEHKDKTKKLLEQQQLKANELKTFISNLMKQKQTAIKSQLQRSEKLIELEASYIEVNKQFQLLKEENQRNFKALQQQKEQNKKLNATIKEGENQRKQQRAKFTKTQEKLKQKEKQLLNKEDLLKKLQSRNEKTIEKYKAEIKELQQQLQLKNNNNLEVSKDTNQKIISLQTQLQRKTSHIFNLEAKLAELEEQIFAQRQTNIKMQQTLTQSKAENEQLRLKIAQMDSNLNEITDESKQKQQKLFAFSGKVYNLELKLQSRQNERNENLQNLNQEWINKYDSMCQQYEQRLELVEKERDYFKSLSEQKDREISKITHAIKIAEANQISLRKTKQQKIKRLEQQKLSLFSQKNNQIQILIQQAKSSKDSIKQKQVQLRRIANELEVARKTILNLDEKSKQYDEKIKGLNKVYQTQLEQLKKKDASNKAYRQSVSTNQWNIQREIKKSLQNFIKNFLQVSDDKNSQKLIELVRSLEKGIIEILSTRQIDK